MADLPKAWLAAYKAPFSYTGVDYFGPMNVIVGRSRAIHIEIAHILRIRNFIARRGTHIEMRSDNGTNLTAVATEMKKLMDQNELQREMAQFDENVIILRHDYRVSQRAADHFWKRWIAEYLPELTRRSKWWEKAKPIQIGDIVMIWSDNRNSWSKGVIVDRTVDPSSDQVRKVEVKTIDGIYTRPAVKVAVLDITTAEEDDKPTSGNAVNLPGGRMSEEYS